jgi:hypothetical protein
MPVNFLTIGSIFMISGDIKTKFIMIRMTQVFTFVLVLGVSIIHTSDADDSTSKILTLESLMETRQLIKETNSIFKEEKVTAAFNKSVLFEGELIYRSPDYLMKHYTSPDEIRYEIIKNTVHIETHDSDTDETENQSVKLDRIPILHAYITALRGTLSGNIKSVREFFEVKFVSTNPHWKITLVPKIESINKIISSLVISGENEKVLQIAIYETSGDSAITMIQPQNIPAPQPH